MRRLTHIATSFGIVAWLVAAHAAGSTNDSVVIGGIPHVLQRPDFCGEACAEMYLRKLGFEITQNDVFNTSGLDPALGRGCYTPELRKALDSIGFITGNVSHKISTSNLDADLAAQWNELHADLLKGIPSIVCMRTSNTAGASEHFRLVTGYDGDKNEVIYHEPAEEDGAYRHMKMADFLKCWPLRYETQIWTVIRIRLELGREVKAIRQEGLSDADYAQHVMQLKKKVPANGGFAMLIQKPFVVLGNENSRMVKLRSENTVKWAVDKLKKAYFKKDPKQIIDIWLFKDDASYMKYAKEIFGDTPTTPFGYSSTEHNALIMNIGTGGGTLVHEIVHPFIDANFPDCPAWFNEGLGSLYEQSADRDGEIVGLTNWRLRDLQTSIVNGDVPSFKTLTGMGSTQFYTEDRGSNYAQARYLCYYLQEKGLLHKFYHKFVENHKTDPTGYETLKAVLGEKDMDAFKTKWEKFVLSLRFP
jgi:hypothetical protein